MLVVHGMCTASGRLALWAEDSARPARLSGRLPRHPVTHPFAAPGEDLLEQLPIASTDVEIGTLTLLLPSLASAPATSPELVRDPLTAGPAPRGKLRLRAWTVPALLWKPGADPAGALRLAADTDLPEGAAGMRRGAALRHLAEVAEFAEELITAGRVLPLVAFEPSGPAARWRPQLSGTDSARYVALREAQPPVCRAERVDPGSGDGRDPAEVLRTTLDALVDGLVRVRLSARSVQLAAPAPAGAATSPEAWLVALTGDPRLRVDTERARELADELSEWQTGGARDTPLRLCFRLRSPDQVETDQVEEGDDGDDWRLEFLLQAVDDPSVLVPATEVWRGQDSVLHRWADAPEELLLAELGRASHLYAGLDSALWETHPVELRLDADGAYRFLNEAATLDRAGFGVLLPSWWGRKDELGLALTAGGGAASGVVTKEDGSGLDALLDYRWDLALGEERLSRAELDELAAAKVPLVRLRGRWVHVDQKRLRAGLDFLARAGSGQMSAGDVLLWAGLDPHDSDVPMPVTRVDGEGRLGDLLSGRVDQHWEPVEPPKSFTATLRPYQRRGLAWLVFLDRLGLGACLADDMGLGKTVQLLALESVARAGERRAPTLLVCPMSVVGNWQREAARFAPDLAVHVHHGTDRLDAEQLRRAVADHDLVITTYALASRDQEALAGVTWDRVVLDEAQNIKNSRSRQSRAVRALKSRHRIALTGTPVENRLAELWSIMDFLNPGMLGSTGTFRARFAVPVERDGDAEAAERLRRITGPFVLRRLKTDPAIIDDLPDKVEMKQLCNLTTEQASLYRAVVDDMLARISNSEGTERRGLVLATMSKLKQVCNHPAHLLGDGSSLPERSGKLARLEEILEQVLADGEKALCFTQFAEFGGMLVPHLAARLDTEALFLHGSTPRATRERIVERFQAADGPSILLLSLKAGGTGLTLTAANHVVHLDRWWNPAVEDQATDRAFRIGQRNDVQVRKLTCIGTLEEKIDRMIEEKKALAQLVVGAGDEWVTELSTNRLRELIALSPEAVGE
ncbi:DEAD/DEAH box helicase [Parasphingorhabdus pacifica]